MDSSTILIASLMIFSIGKTTVSGLNFDPYLFILGRGGGKPFFAPSTDYEEGALQLLSFFILRRGLENE